MFTDRAQKPCHLDNNENTRTQVAQISCFLNVAVQQKEPEFLREGADSRDGSVKLQDEHRASYNARKIESTQKKKKRRVDVSKGHKNQTEGAPENQGWNNLNNKNNDKIRLQPKGK